MLRDLKELPAEILLGSPAEELRDAVCQHSVAPHALGCALLSLVMGLSMHDPDEAFEGMELSSVNGVGSQWDSGRCEAWLVDSFRIMDTVWMGCKGEHAKKHISDGTGYGYDNFFAMERDQVASSLAHSLVSSDCSGRILSVLCADCIAEVCTRGAPLFRVRLALRCVGEL